MTLTFIGNGNMARALIIGLYQNYSIEIYGRNLKNLTEFQQQYNANINLMDKPIDITGKNIILCVKPNALNNMRDLLKGKANTLFSVLAGVSLKSLSENIQSKQIVRAMPNLSATYQKSMTSITGDESLRQTAQELFSKIGDILWLSSENELNIATAIAGSGPAFLALVAEALSDGGVNMGLKREDAQTLVKGLFKGFSPLLQNNLPSDIKDKVMSPAGTTAAGYNALEQNNIRYGFMLAIEEAYNRALKLAKK